MNPSISIIKVLCVDDHDLVRKGIGAILATEKNMRLVGEASTGKEAIAAYRTLQPDVTLMDIHLPELDGISATKAIIRENPAARIIALSSYYGEHEIYAAIEAGVRGYLLKEMVHSEVVNAIRIVHSGKRLIPAEVTERLRKYSPLGTLTEREIEILQLVAQGLGNKDIAKRLGTASGTVKMHLHSTFSKLGAFDRAHAVTLALRRGIIHFEG